VFIEMTSSPGEGRGYEWALTISTVCELGIVGVSLVKSIVDAHSLVMGVRRRILHAKKVFSQPLVPGVVTGCAAGGGHGCSDAVGVCVEDCAVSLEILHMNLEDNVAMEHEDLAATEYADSLLSPHVEDAIFDDHTVDALTLEGGIPFQERGVTEYYDTDVVESVSVVDPSFDARVFADIESYFFDVNGVAHFDSSCCGDEERLRDE
jgi:hypothetical protein